MSSLDAHVLILNKNWTPVDTCTAMKAFSKLFAGAAKFLDIDSYTLHGMETWIELPVRKGDEFVSTWRLRIRVPDVMILRNAASPRRVMRFSRRNLLRRDNFLCQYCGSKDELTIDHVNPRRKGGTSTWTNCVISCVACNTKKGDKTLVEASMSLMPRKDMVAMYPHEPKRWAIPYEPAWSPIFRVPAQQLKKSWLGFLPDGMVRGHVAS